MGSKVKRQVVLLILLLVLLVVLILPQMGGWSLQAPELPDLGNWLSQLPSLSGRPSQAAVEQAVLRYAATRANYGWVQHAEVVEYGRSYTVELRDFGLSRRFWPVKVCLRGQQREEVRRVDLYKDPFGQWIVESIR